MRFEHDKLTYTEMGKFRKKEKFLLWPRQFERKKVRWLEKAVIIERVIRNSAGFFVWSEFDFDDNEDF